MESCMHYIMIYHPSGSTCTNVALSESRAGHCPEMQYNTEIYKLLGQNNFNSKSSTGEYTGLLRRLGQIKKIGLEMSLLYLLTSHYQGVISKI